MNEKLPFRLGVKNRFVTYESDADGTLVIQIDTPDIDEDINGPMIRVYLNDDVLFENPPYPVEN